MTSYPRFQLSSLAIPGAVFMAPLVVRQLLLAEGGFDVGLADLRGLVTDLGVALAIASALIAAAKVSRWLRVAGTVFIAVWCAANFANYEHIRELGSMAGLSQVRYLFDPVFFRGSALKPTHPVLLILTVLISVILAWYGFGPKWKTDSHKLILIGFALIALAALFPPSSTIASWRQNNFLSAQVAHLFSEPSQPQAPVAIESASLAVRDLDGPMIASRLPRARNVLLVILEGASGAYLPSLRQFQGFSPLFDMPELDRIAQKGISYPSFITTQRQTNRGEYALLCGEYPKLITSEANMSELVGKGPLDCLPAVLRDAGFTTVYLQASPMAFMLKDQFMPQAGFEQVHGDGWFEHSYNRNHWGIDDLAFFEQSLGVIEALNQRDEPWFVTLLTVGTHHRYNVPPSFKGTHEPGSAAWAFEYLDHAIGNFILQLEKNGILEDTLVLITSDESQAMIPGAPDTTNMLTQAWGFLIAILPSQETGRVGEVFIQPDIPLSVTDYLDLERGRRLFSGRSVFRRYEGQRDVFWGNVHMRMVAGLRHDNKAVMCTEDFGSCVTQMIDGGRLFAPGHQMRAATLDEIDWLHNAAQRSLLTSSRHLQVRKITLIPPGLYPVISTSSEQYIFGGQFVSIPAHSFAEVEIEAEIVGASGWVDLVNNLVVNLQPRYSRSARIDAGKSLHLGYAINTESRLENVECRLWVTGYEGQDLRLKFLSAELRISPRASAEPVAGIHETTFEITESTTQ